MLYDPIIITGIPRSRTSLVAGMVDEFAFGGETIGPTRDNPYGAFENRTIRETIEKPALKENGFDPMGQDPLPDRQIEIPDLTERVQEIMANDGYESGPWYYKDCKTILTWKAWDEAFPDAKWIWVNRDRDELIHSLQRTHFMRCCNNLEQWDRWCDRYTEFKNQAEIEMLEVDSGDIDSIREGVALLKL